MTPAPVPALDVDPLAGETFVVESATDTGYHLVDPRTLVVESPIVAVEPVGNTGSAAPEPWPRANRADRRHLAALRRSSTVEPLAVRDQAARRKSQQRKMTERRVDARRAAIARTRALRQNAAIDAEIAALG